MLISDKLKLAVAVLIIAASITAYYYFPDVLQIGRVGIVIVAAIGAVALAFTTEVGKSAWAFMKGANIERQKVVWPTRQETLQVSLMVIILVIILGLMMWVFDALSFYAIYDLILDVRGT